MAVVRRHKQTPVNSLGLCFKIPETAADAYQRKQYQNNTSLDKIVGIYVLVKVWGQLAECGVVSPPMFCSVMAIPAAIFPGVPKAL